MAVKGALPTELCARWIFDFKLQIADCKCGQLQRMGHPKVRPGLIFSAHFDDCAAMVARRLASATHKRFQQPRLIKTLPVAWAAGDGCVSPKAKISEVWREMLVSRHLNRGSVRQSDLFRLCLWLVRALQCSWVV